MRGNSPIVQLIIIYQVVVFVTVILSWLRLPPSHPAVQFTRMLTEPVLAPIRKILPQTGGLDFSPMLLLVLLEFLKGFFR